MLTEQLAPRCGRLLAVDAAQAPLVEAARRCGAQGNVTFARLFAPSEWPPGVFDLILLSEVLDYLDAQDVDALADRVSGALSPGGTAALVHWTGETNYPLTADEASEAFVARLGDCVDVVRSERGPQYRLDSSRRR